jgi:chemotaxis protein CheC
MGSFVKLTDEEIDNFREIGNIGAGQAASRLADMINRRCLIDIPDVVFLNKEQINERFDLKNAYAIGLHIRMVGDIPADMIVLSKRSYAQRLVSYITKTCEEIRGKDLSYTAQIALRQIGEVLTRAFADALNSFIRLRTRITMPEIIMETWTTTLNAITERISKEGGPMLVIHSRFYDTEETFDGKFIYIISESSYEIIAGKIKELFG